MGNLNKNIGLGSNNKSGHIGINWSKKSNKWMARIMVDKKSIYLGCFDDITDAVEIRKEAEKAYGFHPDHGKIRKHKGRKR